MDPLCWLLTVAVTLCDPRAQPYEEAARSVPPAHWQLVRQVRVWDLPFAAMDPESGEILLSSTVNGTGLRHEVGHFVAHANEDELQNLFELIFWYEGHPRWRYPKRHVVPSVGEDFADSYAWFIEGRLEACCRERARFMRETVPALAEYEGRARQPD